MNTYNKYFNDAWDLLKSVHPIINLEGKALDMSVKPQFSKKQQCHYMNAIYTVLIIGTREGFISPHVDGHGCVVYWKLTERALS